MAGFRALQDADEGRRQLMAVDIGYSETLASCGVAWAGGDACCLQFGECLNHVESIVKRHPEGVVLVVEAPLSTCHDASGNPTIRGAFESGRGWYYGAGATVTLAAMRFLEQLGRRMCEKCDVVLAEAFLSRKRGPSLHARDASVILSHFWNARACEMKADVEPVGGVVGVPPVRVFHPTFAEGDGGLPSTNLVP